jgi:class 3 adenylate cyclase
VRDCVADHNGEVVKSQGDGFMIVFASSAAALRCAVALQQRLDEENERRGEEPIRVRIGMHTGNIFAADSDFLGRAVVLAARITGRARGGEILVSDDCKRYTDRLGVWRYGDASQLQLKGLSTPTTVHPLDWT